MDCKRARVSVSSVNRQINFETPTVGALSCSSVYQQAISKSLLIPQKQVVESPLFLTIFNTRSGEGNSLNTHSNAHACRTNLEC